jgi:hypothetical protein
MTTPDKFMEALRRQPQVAEVIETDPVMRGHVEAIEYAVDRAYELGNSDAVWQGRYDEVVALLSREKVTIKERLFELGKLFELWRAEQPRKH